MKIKVPVNEPFLLGNEKKYLMKCIKDGFVSSTGPFVEKFEKKFARRLNRKFAEYLGGGKNKLNQSRIKKKESSARAEALPSSLYVIIKKI